MQETREAEGPRAEPKTSRMQSWENAAGVTDPKRFLLSKHSVYNIITASKRLCKWKTYFVCLMILLTFLVRLGSVIERHRFFCDAFERLNVACFIFVQFIESPLIGVVK